MQQPDWNGFDRWHLLFDRLCASRGHVDNAALASQLCIRQGKTAREDFNSAEKNLRNWRLGHHLPLRRNFVLLSELLDVASEPGLTARWKTLYATARGEHALDRDAVPQEPAPYRRYRPLLLGCGLLAAGLLAAGAYWLSDEPYDHLPLIGYKSRVVMALGESRLIHGDRGDCDGGMLPDWEYTSGRVPSTYLGTFSDGGLARKMSNYCNGVVPVRAVRFTATTPGQDEVRLLDDFVRIVVVGPPAPGPR
jgi:hypothetical protein